MRRIAWKRRTEPFGRLRRLSAWELLLAQQEALCIAQSEEAFGLCLNACVLARALRKGRYPAFETGEAVLRALNQAQIEQLCEDYLTRFAVGAAEGFPSAVNPAFSTERFEELRRL